MKGIQKIFLYCITKTNLKGKKKQKLCREKLCRQKNVSCTNIRMPEFIAANANNIFHFF